MLREAERKTLRSRDLPLPDALVYPFPLPQSIGLNLDNQERAVIKSVVENSPAFTAGLKAGDTLATLEGQPLISTADVQWVLDHAPATGTLKAGILRDGNASELSIPLSDGWRSKQDISWRPTTWGFRGMIGGLLTEDLSDEVRAERGLNKESMALLIKHVGQFGPHAAAKNAGFKVNDLIIELDGKTDRITESAVLGQLIQNKKPGVKVKTVVRRGDQRLELMLPMQ